MKQAVKLLKMDKNISPVSDYYDFNTEKRKILYIFPTVVSYGLTFYDLSVKMPEYRFIAFNFIGERSGSDKYEDTVKRLSGNDEVIFLGYSASYALAIETAGKLLKDGIKVSKIILLDSRILSKSDLEGTAEKLTAGLKKYIEENNMDVSEVKRKMDEHVAYIENWKIPEKIETPVYIIRSETGDYNEQLSFGKMTCGDFKIIQGAGQHTEMLSEPFINYNSDIIRNLLNGDINDEITVYTSVKNNTR